MTGSWCSAGRRSDARTTPTDARRRWLLFGRGCPSRGGHDGCLPSRLGTGALERACPSPRQRSASLTSGHAHGTMLVPRGIVRWCAAVDADGAPQVPESSQIARSPSLTGHRGLRPRSDGRPSARERCRRDDPPPSGPQMPWGRMRSSEAGNPARRAGFPPTRSRPRRGGRWLPAGPSGPGSRRTRPAGSPRGCGSPRR
jgi:hypothetical protein